MLLVAVVGIGSSFVSRSNEIHFLNALVSVAIVVAIYVFVGNSGVLSFGQISFVALGAFAAGVMTVPLESKTGVLPDLFPILRDHTIGNVASLVLAAAVGGVFAFLVGLPLMRLSGLAAGIATFAVLEITHNLLREWTKIGPGATTLSLVPESGALQATVGALVVVVVAFAYQRSPLGRKVRATREDPAAAQAVGISVHRQRLWAFTLSGALVRLRRRAARAHARLDHDRAGLPGADVPDAGDAGRRRGHEPLGRRRRRARGQRARLGARERRGRHRRRLHARPARGVASGHTRRADGADADPAPVRAHRRPRAAACGGAHEGLHRRLRGGRVAVRGQSRVAGGRRGVGLRPRARPRRRDQRERAAADRSGGGARDRDPRDRRRRRAAAVRLRDRRDEGDAHRGRDRARPHTRSRTAPSRRSRTASATRRGSHRTSRA